MRRLPPDHPLVKVLAGLLPPEAAWPDEVEIWQEPLPSSRPVFRFRPVDGNDTAVVGKFFAADPPAGSADRSLLKEYEHYLRATDLGLTRGAGCIPRLLGRDPAAGLGLLLQAVPGPNLDQLIMRDCHQGEQEQLAVALESLARLLAFFHTRPEPANPVSARPALLYLDKVRRQLRELGLLTAEDEEALAEEGVAWAERLSRFPDREVLVHGDATPTNFLFPKYGGRGRPPHQVVALDLERLCLADRLWDLSWVAGELKNAWGWRTGNFYGAEEALSWFFAAYLAALPPDTELRRRLFSLNPFYMALAELRIARNAYLSRDYRRGLVAEARRCLAHGRRI